MHWIDPESLSESKHRVRQFLVNHHGDVDGFISAEGEQIHVPSHMGRALTKAVNAGDLVYVRGVRPRGADVLAAVSIESVKGVKVEDHGPASEPRPKKGKKAGRPRDMEGVTERVLYAPRGERVGLLFTNGVVVRIDPETADDLEEFLAPDTRVAVSGNLRTSKWGTVMDAEYLWHPDENNA